MPSIYEKVRTACSEAGISVYALEKELKFPRSSICKWSKNTPGVDKMEDEEYKRMKSRIELLEILAEAEDDVFYKINEEKDELTEELHRLIVD